MNLYVSVVVFFVLFSGMFLVGVAVGKYRVTTRILKLIRDIPNDLFGEKHSYIVRNTRLHILDKFEEGERKWN